MYLACPCTTSFPAICGAAILNSLCPQRIKLLLFLLGSALIRIRFGSWKVRRLNWALKTKFKAFARENEPLFSAEAPVGYPNKNSNFRKVESARGTVGRGKTSLLLFPLPIVPRALSFSLSPASLRYKEAPDEARDNELASVFWDVRMFDLFECIQTLSWLKWIAEVSSWGMAFWF